MPLYIFSAILLVLVLTFTVSLYVERALVRPPVVLASSLLLPVIVFDYRLGALTYLTLISAVAAFLAGYYPWLILSRGRGGRSGVFPMLPDERGAFYGSVVILLFAVAQLAFAMNLLRVFQAYGLSAYFTVSSKDIELVFGRHTAINYLYFLNIYVSALCVYCLSRTTVSRLLLITVLALSLSELLFMGIKSTFIFGSCIAVFVYLVVKKRSVKSTVLLVMALGVSVTALFAVVNLSVLSRGVEGDFVDFLSVVYGAISDYVYYNYINLDLEVANRTTYTFGKYTFFFIGKLVNPGMKGYFDSPDFILLDPNYNMGTFVREYFVDYGAAGVVAIPFFLGNISAYAVNKLIRTGGQRHTVLFGVIMTACAFAFFGNQFIRLQFIYLVVVAYGVDIAASAPLRQFVAYRAALRAGG